VGTQAITFPGPRGTLQGAWAPAAKPRGSVLVIHENRGLTDHIRNVAGRLAANGWSALAIDLLSEEGGTAKIGDEAQVAAILARADPTRFDAGMKAGVSELRRRVRGKNVGAMGFCFGGGMVWRLLAAGETRVAAAAPFYGPFPENGDLTEARAAVLGIYGGLDARVGATRPAARAALKKAGLKNHIVVFQQADHAFFNDTGARFDPAAAAEAGRRVFAWFNPVPGLLADSTGARSARRPRPVQFRTMIAGSRSECLQHAVTEMAAPALGARPPHFSG
jgi:carboxymethylenebutenolidase